MRRIYSALLLVLVTGLVLTGCDSGGGSVPSDLGDSTSVGFVDASATLVEGEDETYNLEIVANDPGFKEIRFDLSIDQGQSTAALGSDVTGLTGDTTVTFPMSTTNDGTVSVPLTIVDEPVDDSGFLENTETLAFTLSPADTLAPAIDDGAARFTLTIEEDDDPLTVAESRSRPSGGRTVADAIVTRVEADGAYLQDGTGAFFVFDSDFANQVSQGDSVRVDGSVGYFNGVFQVSNVSDGALTQVISSGNALPSPQVISLSEVVNNGEEYESELIRVEGFSIDAGGDQTFQGGVPAGLYDISTQNAASTLLVTGSSGLVGEDIPGRANFQGVLGQFNGSGGGGDEPDEGYQLLGLLSSDLEAVDPLPTFDLLADAQALEPSSGNTDAHCLVQRSTGEVVFFNSSDGGIFSYDSGLTVERSASNLNGDIAAEANTIDRCSGVAKDANDNVYFLLRASASSGPTYVYKLPASGSPSVLASEGGLRSLAHHNGTVYLAGVSFDGAPANGFYSVSDTGTGQSVSEVVTESALDLGYGMDVDANGNLYAFSGGFGGTENRTRKIVRVTDPSGSATLSEFVDPYRSGSPLVADSGDDIADVDIVSQNGTEFLVVYNGSFEASNGDQWASIRVSDQSIELLFNRAQLVGNSPASDFVSGFTEPVAVGASGQVFVASRAASFGGEHYIARVTDALP